MKVCVFRITFQIVIKELDQWIQPDKAPKLSSGGSKLFWIELMFAFFHFLLILSVIIFCLLFIGYIYTQFLSNNDPIHPGENETTSWCRCKMLCPRQVPPPKASNQCTLCKLHGQGLCYGPYSCLHGQCDSQIAKDVLTRLYSSPHLGQPSPSTLPSTTQLS